MDQVEKDYADKIVKIQSLTGQSGTGILISNDGLVLTNEHIIPRESCAQERCAGYRALRGFYSGGPNEIYNDVKVLAQNKELDIALIKINIPAWKKVPYFIIHNLEEFDFNDHDRYALIGHPFGASAKHSNAVILENKGNFFDLHTIALSGSSGSPVIDRNTGKVVGLYRGGKWSKETVNKKTGNVIHVGQAVNMNEILKLLEKGFPGVFAQESTVSHLSLILTSISRRDTRHPVANFYPMKKSELITTYNTDVFLNLVIGTADEYRYVRGYTKFLEALILGDSLELNQELDHLVNLFTLLKAYNLSFSQQTNSYISYWARRWLPDLGVNVRLLLEVINQTPRCLEHIPDTLSDLEKMQMRSLYCDVSFDSNGELIIDVVSDRFNRNEFREEESQSYLKLLTSLMIRFSDNPSNLRRIQSLALGFSELTETLPAALRFEALAAEIQLILDGANLNWSL